MIVKCKVDYTLSYVTGDLFYQFKDQEVFADWETLQEYLDDLYPMFKVKIQKYDWDVIGKYPDPPNGDASLADLLMGQYEPPAEDDRAIRKFYADDQDEYKEQYLRQHPELGEADIEPDPSDHLPF